MALWPSQEVISLVRPDNSDLNLFTYTLLTFTSLILLHTLSRYYPNRQPKHLLIAAMVFNRRRERSGRVVGIKET
jgi:hypothetical protein